METARPLIVFDMDGVLVDVTESYRETIVQTVLRFSGHSIERARIQDYKNQGGWNNDWALSQRILADLGMDIPYATVVEEFQRIFFGENGSAGLMEREQWMDSSGVLHRLALKYRFAVFTGRLREEAGITLRRFAANLPFHLIVGDDDVSHSKPHPEGLLKIVSGKPASDCRYVGDTVDDARAARDARVPFIGVGHRRDPGHAHAVDLMEREGAIAIVESINELERVLPA